MWWSHLPNPSAPAKNLDTGTHIDAIRLQDTKDEANDHPVDDMTKYVGDGHLKIRFLETAPPGDVLRISP